MGTGIHGGFGNTKGSNRQEKIGIIKQVKASHTRDSLIKELHGHTEISTKIAEGLKKNNIHINVLGDYLFENYLGVGKKTVAVTIGKQIYLRSSSATIISDLVHEGTHVLDYLSGISVNNIKTWSGEIRAYKAERDFQIKTKRKLDFATEDDLYVHVWSNYKRGE